MNKGLGKLSTQIPGTGESMATEVEAIRRDYGLIGERIHKAYADLNLMWSEYQVHGPPGDNTSDIRMADIRRAARSLSLAITTLSFAAGHLNKARQELRNAGM